MITRAKERELQGKAIEILRETGFPITEKELEKIAVADFGLGMPEREGAQILTLFATERISAKLIVLLPGQVLPEHWHPPVGEDPGKEEIIRGYWGTVLYFDDQEGKNQDTQEIPQGKEHCYVCRSRRDLVPGAQEIIPPGRKHWLKGGVGGGCVISFSTCVRDILDQFTDTNIVRTTQILDSVTNLVEP
jgi:D-lyxose ketol-isomerase